MVKQDSLAEQINNYNLLYGAEIWGFGNLDVLERIQLKFLKYLFNLKKSTPSYMIYGELGIMPITVDIQARTLDFWCKLIENNNLKLSALVYKTIYALTCNGQIRSNWLNNIQNLVNSLGFSGVWQSQYCNII